MTYRGISGMEGGGGGGVHLYRWRELKSAPEVRRVPDRRRPGDRRSVHAAPIAAPWFGHSLRAGGWIVFASRPE